MANSDWPYYRLKIDLKVWNKDSHGLYDYHNQEMFNDKFMVSGNCLLYRHDEDHFKYKVTLPTEDPGIENKRIL